MGDKSVMRQSTACSRMNAAGCAGSGRKRRRTRSDPRRRPRVHSEACKGGAQSPGSFLHAGPISEAVNLYAIALRTRKRLLFDAEAVKITNLPEANRYLSRDYRKGWEPETV